MLPDTQSTQHVAAKFARNINVDISVPTRAENVVMCRNYRDLEERQDLNSQTTVNDFFSATQASKPTLASDSSLLTLIML